MTGDHSTYSWRDKFNFNDKEVDLFNIDDLEAKIDYDLFSNIPDSIQNAIENQSIANIEVKLNLRVEFTWHHAHFPIEVLQQHSVWHSSLPNQIPTTTNTIAVDNSSFKISLSENSFLERSTSHISSSKASYTGVYVPHIGSSEIGIVEGTPNQISSIKVGITNDGIADVAFVHENSSQVSTSQIDSNHTNLLEISSSQINVSQNDFLEIDSRIMSGRTIGVDKLDSCEVTFPIVVSDQQFFRSDFPNHNSTSQIIDVLNNTATNIWSDLLQSETQLNINFQITDLP